MAGTPLTSTTARPHDHTGRAHRLTVTVLALVAGAVAVLVVAVLVVPMLLGRADGADRAAADGPVEDVAAAGGPADGSARAPAAAPSAQPVPTESTRTPVSEPSSPAAGASPALVPTSSPAPVPGPVSDADQDVVGLVVPALGIDVAVGEVSPSGGVIDPPRLDLAYVIEPYGRPGSDNTTYIAGHSWNAGDAVFNPLLDVEQGLSRLDTGDEIEVTTAGSTFTYAVTGTDRHPKGSLAGVDEVWEKVPGRLVLITCFQRNDGAASQDNLVVVAELVQESPVQAAGLASG